MWARRQYRVADCREQFAPIERFLEYAIVTCARARQATQHFGVTGNEEDRQFRPGFVHRIPELESIHDGHVDVRDQTIDLCQTAAFEHRRSGGKNQRAMVCGLQQILERFENARVVIDDSNDGAGGMISHGGQWGQ